MKKEIRVYLVYADNLEDDFYEISNEKVIEIAEKTGHIFSLKGFESALNTDEISIYGQFFVRFIEVEVPQN